MQIAEMVKQFRVHSPLNEFLQHLLVPQTDGERGDRTAFRGLTRRFFAALCLKGVHIPVVPFHLSVVYSRGARVEFLAAAAVHHKQRVFRPSASREFYDVVPRPVQVGGAVTEQPVF